MNASLFVPIALIASVAIGALLVVFAAISVVGRKDGPRWRSVILALFSALAINSWWIAFVGMAIYKLFILQEDT